ncbi:Epithelial splicing regulatory protein 1, partial [Mucuna pruriens]
MVRDPHSATKHQGTLVIEPQTQHYILYLETQDEKKREKIRNREKKKREAKAEKGCALFLEEVEARVTLIRVCDLGFTFCVIAALDPYRLPPSTEAPFGRSFGDPGNMYGPRGGGFCRVWKSEGQCWEPLGGGGLDGYEVGSKRQRMMESNPYFAVSSRTGSLTYGYVGGFLHPPPFTVVHLRGLPFNYIDIDILKFFAGLTVVDVLLVNKMDGSRVEFALQRDRLNMGHRYVEVFRCKKQDYYNAVAAEINYEGIYDNDYHGSSPPPSRLKRFSDKYQMEYTEILKMHGLPFQVAKSQIVHIVCCPDGKAIGEACVEFVSDEEAKRAISKDKMTVGSRYVELFPSTPDEARQAESRSRQYARDSVDLVLYVHV